MAVRKLDVLQVITADHRRGAETYAVDLGAALTDRCRRVSTVALTTSPTEPRLDVDVLGGAARAPATLRALRQRARTADVVVAHGSSTLSACAVATAGGPPFVYRVIGDLTVWAPSGWRKAMVGTLLRRASAIAVYHQAAADALVGHHGLARAAIRVLPKGIDIDRWPEVTDAGRAAARRSLGVADGADGGPVVAWLGALTAEKRPELAIEVAAALPEATLLMAGTGPIEPAVTVQAAATGRRVHLLGSVTDVGRVLAAADVVLLTSRTEGVPGVALEAAASGLPVVAVDVGGVPEVVLDRRTGRLVDADSADLVRDLAAAVRWALDDRAALGAAGRAHVVDHLAIGDVADRWVELLATVAARG